MTINKDSITRPKPAKPAKPAKRMGTAIISRPRRGIRLWHGTDSGAGGGGTMARAASQPAAPAAKRTPCVVLVEDDADTREALADILEAEGYNVAVAANGQEALDTLHETGTAKLIVLDLMMPVMDGWEFRRIQQQDPQLEGIPVIVVSGAADLSDGIMDIGAVAYLTKPLNLNALLDAVAEYCG